MQIPDPPAANTLSPIWTQVGVIATCLCFLVATLPFFGVQPSLLRRSGSSATAKKPRAYSIWVGFLFTIGFSMSGFIVWTLWFPYHPRRVILAVAVLAVSILVNWILVLRNSTREDTPSKLVIDSASYAAIEGGGIDFDVIDCLRQMITGNSLVLDIENHNFVVNGRNFVPKDPQGVQRQKTKG
jgi:hypothetical protein